MILNTFIGTSVSACCAPSIVLQLRWSHKWNKYWLAAFLSGKSKSFTEEMKHQVYYGKSSKGSKCYEVQTRETSPWLERSWERSSALATVLTVPRRDVLFGYSSMNRGPGLGAQRWRAGTVLIPFVLVVQRMVVGMKIRARFWRVVDVRAGAWTLFIRYSCFAKKKGEHLGVRIMTTVGLSGGSVMCTMDWRDMGPERDRHKRGRWVRMDLDRVGWRWGPQTKDIVEGQSSVEPPTQYGGRGEAEELEFGWQRERWWR